MNYRRLLTISIFSVLLLFSACSTERLSETTESVWIINKMQLKDNHKISQYYQSLQANWAKPREIGKQMGFIEEYEIVSIPKGDSWEFLLMTKYNNQSDIDIFQNEFSQLLVQANPMGTVLIDGYSPRDFAKQVEAKIMSDEEFRQLIGTINTGGV